MDREIAERFVESQRRLNMIRSHWLDVYETLRYAYLKARYAPGGTPSSTPLKQAARIITEGK